MYGLCLLFHLAMSGNCFEAYDLYESGNRCNFSFVMLTTAAEGLNTPPHLFVCSRHKTNDDAQFHHAGQLSNYQE